MDGTGDMKRQSSVNTLVAGGSLCSCGKKSGARVRLSYRKSLEERVKAQLESGW